MNPTETTEKRVSAPKPGPPQKEPASRGRGRAFLIFFLVLAVLAAAGVWYWLHSRDFEDTDDAFIETHINPVSSRIDGVIIKVYTDNNRTVKAGDPLVDLDPSDYQIAVDRGWRRRAAR